MKIKIICILVISLLIASAILPVAGTMKFYKISAEKNPEYKKVQNEILGLLLDNSWQLKYNYPFNILNDGAIWTTLDDCGDIQQNVNHYYAGDDVYVNGANFDPDTGLNWNIVGAPCSCDPEIVIANGIVYTDSHGDFCINAYTVQGDDCGVYHLKVGNKNDNFKVVSYENDPPMIYYPNPTNYATDIAITITELSVTIEDPEGDTIDWTIETTPNIGSNSGTNENNGTKTCSISNLEYDTTYTWYVNATDLYGSGNTIGVFYTFTTMSSDPPVISNPDPTNGTIEVSVTLPELSVTIEDPEGDTIDWTIETTPNIGSNSGTNENNGTKTCSISNLEYDTTYTWYVNATDPNGSGQTTTKIYTFTTEPNLPPIIFNPDPPDGATDAPVTLSELSVTIEDPEGDTIDWTIETSPNIGSSSGTGEYNGTKTCSVSNLEYDTTYTWYVNATDLNSRGGTTEEIYTFTTIASTPPVISNPEPPNNAINIAITLSELSVTIEDPEGDTIDWTIETSPNIGSSTGTGEYNGTKTCSVSGLEYNTVYTWYVNATDPSGSGQTTNKVYTFTTMSNDPPVISNPDPINGDTDISVSLSELSVTIEDPEGDTIDWTIETSPNIGSNSGTGENNGTKTCSISNLEYDTTYTWYVNATDPSGSGQTTTKIYTFTTEPNLPPIIFNPDPEDGLTGVSIYVSELTVTIEDPEGDSFIWTIETSPYIGSSGNSTGDSNGTKTCDVYCGLDYNTTFTWFVNATDPGGSGQTTYKVYTFTTEEEGNNPPVISKPDPPNDATDVSITLSELSVLIEDPEGDLFDWSFETSPDIGSCSGNGEVNGTKICSVFGLEYGTIYRWYVETTDPDGSGKTRRRSFIFTTELGPPITPDGPMYLDIGENAEYCTSINFPDVGLVQYRFDWNAAGSHDYSGWSDFVSPGIEICMDHSWSNWGTYVVKAQVRDKFGSISDWSDGLSVMVGNHPPDAPVIEGPISGKPGTSYSYTFTSADPEGDQVSYYVKWDDGSITDWTGFQASGPPGYSESHTWDEKGSFIIKAKAKDVHGVASDWGTLTVTMPRNKVYINMLFLKFLQSHPNLSLLLQLLLQRFGLQ